jgi:hypothetical protein
MVELAWLWLQNQPTSALSLWFHERVRLRGRMRKTIIVALARKLLVALWRYTTAGVVIEGAVMKAAPATILPHPQGPHQSCRIKVAEPERPLASTADRKNGPGLLSPHPPDAGCWCSRNKRRPYVSLIWCSTPSGHGNGLRPWIRNNDRRTPHEPLNLT